MRLRGRAVALLASAAMTLATGLVVAPSVRAAVGGSADAVVMVVCTSPAWAEGNSYVVGSRVTFNGRLYESMVAHTAWPGAGWNPAATPTLWRDLGACAGGTPSPTPTPSPSTPGTPTPSPSTPRHPHPRPRRRRPPPAR